MSEPDASGWRPIETAPKDAGTPNIVLACFYFHRDEDGEYTGNVTKIWLSTGRWLCGRWQTLSSCFSGMSGSAWMQLRDDPTHWMPLPKSFPSPPMKGKEDD